MYKKLFVGVVAIALAMAFAPPAGAGAAPATSIWVEDFVTAALDADGCFKLVHCTRAHQVSKPAMGNKGAVVRETYQCEFVMDPNGLGIPELPKKATVWDYYSANSDDIDWEACDFVVEPPYRWFSDVEDILNGDTLCWMYTNPFGEDIGDSSWRMVITPSGNVNVTVVYDPPVFEGPECP